MGTGGGVPFDGGTQMRFVHGIWQVKRDGVWQPENPDLVVRWTIAGGNYRLSYEDCVEDEALHAFAADTGYRGSVVDCEYFERECLIDTPAF